MGLTRMADLCGDLYIPPWRLRRGRPLGNGAFAGEATAAGGHSLPGARTLGSHTWPRRLAALARGERQLAAAQAATPRALHPHAHPCSGGDRDAAAAAQRRLRRAARANGGRQAPEARGAPGSLGRRAPDTAPVSGSWQQLGIPCTLHDWRWPVEAPSRRTQPNPGMLTCTQVLESEEDVVSFIQGERSAPRCLACMHESAPCAGLRAPPPPCLRQPLPLAPTAGAPAHTTAAAARPQRRACSWRCATRRSPSAAAWARPTRRWQRPSGGRCTLCRRCAVLCPAVPRHAAVLGRAVLCRAVLRQAPRWLCLTAASHGCLLETSHTNSSPRPCPPPPGAAVRH